MHMQGYLSLAEDAVGDREALDRLWGAIDRDPELSDAERSTCAARVGQYLADSDRAQAVDGEYPAREEDFEDGA